MVRAPAGCEGPLRRVAGPLHLSQQAGTSGDAMPPVPDEAGAPAPAPEAPGADVLDLGADLVRLQMHESNRFAMGMVTTLLLLCCLCLGGCSVYTCLRAWRRYHALSGEPSEKATDMESALPNYTLVSGLPTYDEALDQLQQRRELRRSSSAQRAIELAVAAARAAGNLMAVKRLQAIRRLSVGDLIQYSFRAEPFSNKR
ncbi:Protein commissureless 2 [Frankliniella fusca]|uniref:Protein commissureless 2 n=1 Tax=Frankliniella fusca TaxID=407009 RepID=A0AAE1GZD9_9NEOP|nr:Protein commissureless 2 [Frankliniella fusca]